MNSADKKEKLIKEKDKIDKFIKEIRSIIRNVEVYGRKVRDLSSVPGLDILRGNFVGNSLRHSKHSKVNKNIDRVQAEILDFRTKLMLYDKDLAKSLTLPTKLTGFEEVNSKLSDIVFRTNIRLKEVDINKAKNNLVKVFRKLVTKRKNINYELKKLKEEKYR
ncbi:MAG: hypothetical protein SOU08_08250 [Anaerococcus sp.]|nr:hypothetical protein [Anaerococcus sp.]